MTIETFPCTVFRVGTQYPDNASRVKFGKSYTATAEPDAPPERIFTLKMKGFKYYITSGGDIDLTTNASINNAGKLETFYLAHQTWKTFNFTHPNPMIGAILCRFNNPLNLPEGIEGADGMLPEFEIKLVEAPIA